MLACELPLCDLNLFYRVKKVIVALGLLGSVRHLIQTTLSSAERGLRRGTAANAELLGELGRCGNTGLLTWQRNMESVELGG